jgi:hypothetical protein
MSESCRSCRSTRSPRSAGSGSRASRSRHHPRPYVSPSGPYGSTAEPCRFSPIFSVCLPGNGPHPRAPSPPSRHSSASWPWTRLAELAKSSSPRSAVWAAGFRYSRVSCSTASVNPPFVKSQSADGHVFVVVRRAATRALVSARPSNWPLFARSVRENRVRARLLYLRSNGPPVQSQGPSPPRSYPRTT